MRYTRIHAAREHRRQTSWKETTLSEARTFSAADLIALLSASALIAIYSLRHSHLLADRRNLLLSLGITAAFALLAWRARGVNWSGALAGSAIAFILASRDLRMFGVLLLVFILTFAATQTGRSRKQQLLRAAENSAGRSASQVMANLGVAGLVVALAPQAWTLLALAALAEAAADTTSSEIGLAFPGKTVLLTSWKPVSPGIDGGVSAKGTLAAVAAAGVIAAAAALMKLVGGNHALAVVYAGVLGSLVDSLFGALLERRGFLNNDLVNLLSTAAAVAIAGALL
jgi:uncharacterized protein (TIGR00297 family)